MQRVPPFVYSIFNERYETGRDYTVPPLNFFRHCATFFRIFFVAKGSPFKFFDILQQTEVSKSPNGLPFLLFRHYETVSKFSFFVFFSKIFSKNFSNFFNVSKGSPSIFLIFCNKLDFQKAQMVSPFYFFGTMRLFQNSHFSFFFQKYFQKIFRIFLMSPKGLLQFFWYFATNWIFKKPKWSPLSTFSALWDCFKILIFRFFFKNIFKKFFEFF